MVMRKVKDPRKRATDPVLLRHLKKEKVNKDYVEFEYDYGTLVYTDRLGHTKRNYYSKRYLDHVSGKRFTVVSGLPMCRQDGTKIVPGFDPGNGRHYIKTNLMEGEVADNGLISLEPVNDQPYGILAGESLIWNPKLFLDGVEQEIISGPILLPLDPWNKKSVNNVLVFDYGICQRLVRIIPGKLKERWIFLSDPGGTVRIVHNHTGKVDFRLGQHAVGNDIEEIPAEVFNLVRYPFEIFTDSTFYPDKHVETTSVDGRLWHNGTNVTWATLVGGAGTGQGSTEAANSFAALNCGNVSGKFNYLIRGIFVYDASLIQGDIVSAGTFSLYGDDKQDNTGTSDSVNVYESAPAANNNLVSGDFDSLGSTPFCETAIAYGDFDAAGWNAWILNTAGIAFLQAAADGDGIVKLGTRYNLDVSGTPDWASAVWDEFSCEYADNNGNKPKLAVTHNPLSAPTVSTVIPAENITGVAARIKGNVTDTGGENPTRYLQYGKTVAYELGSLNKGVGGTGIYLHDLSSLDTGTLYYFRAYATNSGGTGYGAQADFTTIADIEKSLSASFEVEASIGRKLTFPLSAIIEIESLMGRKLTFPLSALMEIEAEAGRHLVLPLSALIEIEAYGILRAGIHKALSASFEIEAEAGRHLVFPLSALMEIEAVGNLNLIKPLSALIEMEAYGGKRIGLFSKSDVLINIWNVDKQVN